MPRLDMNTMYNIIKNYVQIEEVRTIYDIGCMDGADSLLLSKLFPSSTVYGFEAMKKNYEICKKHCNDKCYFFNSVISDKDGYVSLFEKEVNGIHSMYEQNIRKTIRKHNNIPCYSILTMMHKHSLPLPNLVKIDVEGATYEVLVGFGSSLRNVKILQIETEEQEYFNGQKLENQVLDYLKTFPFKIIHKTSAINVKQNDFILINKEQISNEH